jgi:hypothetical protein
LTQVGLGQIVEIGLQHLRQHCVKVQMGLVGATAGEDCLPAQFWSVGYKACISHDILLLLAPQGAVGLLSNRTLPW